jgi:hypothetical protein
MTARIFSIPEKARGHRPRLQLPIVWFCNTLLPGGARARLLVPSRHLSFSRVLEVEK